MTGSEPIAFPTVKAPPAPTRVGRYEIVGTLGQGGMAAVYLARTRGPAGFQKLFAIKKVHAHLASDRQFASMFLDEARIAAALHHPNIAHVFELGEDQGSYFLAMEYLLGDHLGAVERQLIQLKKPAPIDVMARIVALAAEGLHHAHDAADELGQPLHIVHRDVSPQNIFVTYAGHVKLTDFGVAKATSNEVRTDTGTVKGKFAYMAPEQALGRAVDRRTDVFALGVVLWEAITLQRLFRSPTDAETLLKVTQCDVSPPSSRRAEIPPELDRIVLRCLAREPADRFATAGELAHELEAFLAPRPRAAPAAIGALMSELFAAEIERRQSDARRALSREVSLSSEEPASTTAPTSELGNADTISHSQSRPVTAPSEPTHTPPVPLVALRHDLEASAQPDEARTAFDGRRADARRADARRVEERPVDGRSADERPRSRWGAALLGVLVPALFAAVGVVMSLWGGPPDTRTPTGTQPLAQLAPDAGSPAVPDAHVESLTPDAAPEPPAAIDAEPAPRRPLPAHRTPRPSIPFRVEITCAPAAEVIFGATHDETPFMGVVAPGVTITLRNERGERVIRPTPGPDGVAHVPRSMCP